MILFSVLLRIMPPLNVCLLKSTHITISIPIPITTPFLIRILIFIQQGSFWRDHWIRHPRCHTRMPLSIDVRWLVMFQTFPSLAFYKKPHQDFDVTQHCHGNVKGGQRYPIFDLFRLITIKLEDISFCF